MHDTEILRRVRHSWLTEMDQEEILSIFASLSEKKRIQVLEKWDTIVASIQKRRNTIESEKEFLLRGSLNTLYSYVETFDVKK